VIEEIRRPNGLLIRKLRRPDRRDAITDEARPTSPSTAPSLCLKSGNASIIAAARSASTQTPRSPRDRRGARRRAVAARAVQMVTQRPTAPRSIPCSKIDTLIHGVIQRGGEGLSALWRRYSTIPSSSHYKACASSKSMPATSRWPEAITRQTRRPPKPAWHAAEQLLRDRQRRGTVFARVARRASREESSCAAEPRAPQSSTRPREDSDAARDRGGITHTSFSTHHRGAGWSIARRRDRAINRDSLPNHSDASRDGGTRRTRGVSSAEATQRDGRLDARKRFHGKASNRVTDRRSA